MNEYLLLLLWTSWLCCGDLHAIKSAKQIAMQALVRNLKTGMMAILPGFVSSKATASTTKGAFELDLEYYMNDLLKKDTMNKKEQLFFPSPRKLDLTIATDIYDIIVDGVERVTNLRNLNDAVDKNLDEVLSKYRTFVPIQKETFADQYYFDIRLYALYKIIFDKIPNTLTRVTIREGVAKSIAEYINKKYPKTTFDNNPLINMSNDIERTLEFFKSIGFVDEYKYNKEDVIDDNLSNYNTGYPISTNIVLVRPVGLIPFLTFEKDENTMFHPEIYGSVIKYLGEMNGVVFTFEDYLLDEYYRERAREVTAQDILLEIVIKKKT